jgi:hypothetical protein
MTTRDLVHFAGTAVLAHRLRSALTITGIVIGIASVILLTSLGQGTREYIATEFAQFGTNLLQINPGRTTTGGIPTPIGSTVRKITIEDAEAIGRLPVVERVLPLAFGQARVEAGTRARSVYIYGVTSDVPAVWKFQVGQGRFLPPVDPRHEAPLAVLGPKVMQELFGDSNPLGAYVRIGGRRFQVIGVMAPKGQLLGFDIDDSVYIPVSIAQELFNQDGLVEIDVLFSHAAEPGRAQAAARQRRGLHYRDADADARHGRSRPRHRELGGQRHRRDLARCRRHRRADHHVDCGQRTHLGDWASEGDWRDAVGHPAHFPGRGHDAVVRRRRDRDRRRIRVSGRHSRRISRRPVCHLASVRRGGARDERAGRAGVRGRPRPPRDPPESD